MICCITGDIEAKGEEEITKLLHKDYDILKIAHHGSKNSTSMEFLDKVKAEYGIISCGENNRYGHPHKELLQRLEEKEMEILNTKDMGAITIHYKRPFYYGIGILGNNTKKRAQFRQMIANCEAGKITRVITKSISRFARNT